MMGEDLDCIGALVCLFLRLLLHRRRIGFVGDDAVIFNFNDDTVF